MHKHVHRRVNVCDTEVNGRSIELVLAEKDANSDTNRKLFLVGESVSLN